MPGKWSKSVQARWSAGRKRRAIGLQPITVKSRNLHQAPWNFVHGGPISANYWNHGAVNTEWGKDTFGLISLSRWKLLCMLKSQAAARFIIGLYINIIWVCFPRRSMFNLVDWKKLFSIYYMFLCDPVCLVSQMIILFTTPRFGKVFTQLFNVHVRILWSCACWLQVDSSCEFFFLIFFF